MNSGYFPLIVKETKLKTPTFFYKDHLPKYVMDEETQIF
jgi:hypothetical protein